MRLTLESCRILSHPLAHLHVSSSHLFMTIMSVRMGTDSDRHCQDSWCENNSEETWKGGAAIKTRHSIKDLFHISSRSARLPLIRCRKYFNRSTQTMGKWFIHGKRCFLFLPNWTEFVVSEWIRGCFIGCTSYVRKTPSLLPLMAMFMPSSTFEASQLSTSIRCPDLRNLSFRYTHCLQSARLPVIRLTDCKLTIHRRKRLVASTWKAAGHECSQRSHFMKYVHVQFQRDNLTAWLLFVRFKFPFRNRAGQCWDVSVNPLNLPILFRQSSKHMIPIHNRSIRPSFWRFCDCFDSSLLFDTASSRRHPSSRSFLWWCSRLPHSHRSLTPACKMAFVDETSPRFWEPDYHHNEWPYAIIDDRFIQFVLGEWLFRLPIVYKEMAASDYMLFCSFLAEWPNWTMPYPTG